MHRFIQPSFRLALLGGIAASALAGGAQAQTASDPTTSTVDDIVVTGRRPIAESEAAALLIQRRSDSLVTVAASDSVGRLPDQNVAQAVARLPGAAVDSDQGQPRYISLRGAPKNWTTLSIDGIGIVSPEGRDTRYDNLPSAIAAQIIVAKAVTPDMTGETISGNVNIVTRSAFDYQGPHLAGKLGAGLVQLGDRKEYEANLLASTRFDTGMGEIGLLASASFYERNMVTDNYEIDWELVSQDIQPGGFGATPSGNRLWAREIENKLYRLTRRNYSRTGRIDWAPNDTNRLFFQSIFTTFTDDEARDNYIFDTDDRQADAPNPPRPVGNPCTVQLTGIVSNTGYADTCIGNTSLTGVVYGIDINQRATLRAFEQSIFTNTLGGHHEVGGWTADWRLNFTRAIDDRSVTGEARYESPSTRNLRPSIAYNFADVDFQNIQLFRTITTGTGTATRYSLGARVTNIDDFQRNLTSLTSLDAVDTTEAYTARFDAHREFALMGGDARFTFGLQYDDRTKESIENQLSLTAAQAATAAVSSTFLPVSLDAPFKGELPMGYTFRYFDLKAMGDQIARASNLFPYNPVTANYYKVTEQVASAYGMLRVGYDWGSILGGARVEQITNTGEAIVALGGVNTPIEVENDEVFVYPSLHVNYNVNDEMKLRVSFNTGAARPDYDQLRPNFTFSDSNLTVSGGNPEAKPERAYGVDAYLEWYMQPQGFAMAGVFYKKVEDVLFGTTRTFGLDVLNSGGVDRSGYTLNTIGNGGDGYIYGLELALQQQIEPYSERLGLPDWVGGFGLSANVTLNSSEAAAPDGSKVSLPNTSDVIYNVGLYYERYGLSARLNYRYRTEWLDAYGAAVDGGNTYWATDDELDYSARYAVNDHAEIYFDASNLLNNPGRRYSRESIYTIEWERFGRRFDIGVRFNF
ncbi:TonB-dependent receptor [Brevundimonas sp.]|uniref:TonB-dependent receptor n=1 Tax=Brevundimonas sp. TaxID=1871086 RepID=UPI001A244A2F|nr:TonB-dependent receptor [Brevundimonas sp.]MBJ7484814.1 TonB-dependent receptor [Brevundimonas sp.]